MVSYGFEIRDLAFHSDEFILGNLSDLPARRLARVAKIQEPGQFRQGEPLRERALNQTNAEARPSASP